MPTYEYRCPEGHLFEKLQKFSDPPGAACPTCGRPGERLISAAGLVFKGSGFYINDYGKDGKGARKPEKEPSAEAGGEKRKEKKDKPEGKAAPPSEKGGSSSSGSSSKPSGE